MSVENEIDRLADVLSTLHEVDLELPHVDYPQLPFSEDEATKKALSKWLVLADLAEHHQFDIYHGTTALSFNRAVETKSFIDENDFLSLRPFTGCPTPPQELAKLPDDYWPISADCSGETLVLGPLSSGLAGAKIFGLSDGEASFTWPETAAQLNADEEGRSASNREELPDFGEYVAALASGLEAGGFVSATYPTMGKVTELSPS